jgi:hypothetical protein
MIGVFDMSVTTLLQRAAVKHPHNGVLSREGNDVVVHVSVRALLSMGGLLLAAVLGSLLTMDHFGYVHLSDFGRFLSDTMCGLALWLPLNHRKHAHDKK